MFSRVFLPILLLLAIATAQAEVTLPCVFHDHMVLQREMKIPVWGWAAPGEQVTVTLNGKTAVAVADAAGAWNMALPPMPAGGPYVLTATGANRVSIQDVLIGEVWLCSGQSNMEMGVNGAQNAKDEMAAANYPNIRLFFGGGDMAESAQADEKNGSWWVCAPDTVGYFSAVGYYFARAIHLATKVPVGIINVSWSGTQIEGWIPREAYAADPALTPLLDTIKTPLTSAMPSVIYNGRIHPLVPFALRGVLWYQGEANANRAALYRKELPALICGWRQAWGEGNFPFLIVQLPNYQAVKDAPGESQWAELREAQAMALALPETGLAVTIDIGEAENIHPKNKQEVARRLALIALNTTYHGKEEYSGPRYERMKINGSTIQLTFSHLGGGLAAHGGKLTGFAIAGADGKFVWADAVIKKQTVRVSSPLIANPTMVRYAWADNPVCNLYNKLGLPAAPFRTDVPVETTQK